jgi:hypothetical protein
VEVYAEGGELSIRKMNILARARGEESGAVVDEAIGG